jgi:hypothetical protein
MLICLNDYVDQIIYNRSLLMSTEAAIFPPPNLEAGLMEDPYHPDDLQAAPGPYIPHDHALLPKQEIERLSITLVEESWIYNQVMDLS